MREEHAALERDPEVPFGEERLFLVRLAVVTEALSAELPPRSNMAFMSSARPSSSNLPRYRRPGLPHA
jgi:hypothetical protein